MFCQLKCILFIWELQPNILNSQSYFTNVNPHDYLLTKNNEKYVNINELEDKLFHPNKILEIFGKPNPDYLNVLNKALALKSSKKYQNTEVAVDINLNSTQAKINTKGDLYFLSIGVSDYKQSDFNLTYADKDALDMSSVYGKLSDKELNDYNTKFHGKKWKLFSEHDSLIGQINKYEKDYNLLSDLQMVSTDGRYWLEADNSVYYFCLCSILKHQTVKSKRI